MKRIDSAEDIWIGHQDQGLLRLRGGNVEEQIPWSKFGVKDFESAMLADPSTGGLWLAFWKGGIAHFKDGQITKSYTAAHGLGAGMIGDLSFDRDGALWAATEGGLSRIKDGRITTMTTAKSS